MILIALGANLPSRFGTPPQTLYAALMAMAERGVWPDVISRVWRSAPVPFVEGQPWYYNAVAAVKTEHRPYELLRILLEIEAAFGRMRTVRNAPRLLDLDLIAYGDEVVMDGPELILPHPRMRERAFVLLPLSDVVDEWTHPLGGETLESLIRALPKGQQIDALADGWKE